MASKLFGYRQIQKLIEKKLILLSEIPAKYFESLYIECSTKIPCHTLEILEMEEKNIRNTLLKLMQNGEVDTKVEIEKFQLFQRINDTLSRIRELKLLLTEHLDKITEQNHKQLLELLKKASKTAKIMQHSVVALYDNYDQALEEVAKLKSESETLLNDLYKFKFCDHEGKCEYSFEDPEVLIGNSLRDSLQEIIEVGKKVEHIVKTFSYKYNNKPKQRRKKNREQQISEGKHNEESRD